MGSFSFNRADRCTRKANFVSFRDKLKLLIPKEFVEHYGADHFTARYDDYGMITVHKPDGTPAALDLIGLVAYWNDPEHYTLKDDGWTDTKIQENRVIGVNIMSEISEGVWFRCKYPLKVVSPSCRAKYEDLEFFSDTDTEQGWVAEYWDGHPHYGSAGQTFLDLYDRLKVPQAIRP